MMQRTWAWKLTAGTVATLSLCAGAAAQATTSTSETPKAPAPAAKPAADLPSAKSLHEKYLEAIGGREAMLKLKSRVAKGSIAIPAQSLKGKMTTYGQAPNRARMLVEIEGIGTIDRGTDGTVAWETNPMTGPRLLDGEEKADFIRMADLYADLNYDKNYTMETVAQEKVGSAEAYKVKLTGKDKSVVTHFYDVKTGLLIRRDEVVKMQGNEIPSETNFEDYKTFGTIKSPATSRQKAMGMEQVLTIDSMEFPEQIEGDKLSPPADVKALLDKKPASDKPAEGKPSENKPGEKSPEKK